MNSEDNYSNPMNHQQEEEDESRHLLIQSLIDTDTTHHGLWEEQHQNYPVRRYDWELQHDLLNRNTVAYNANNPQQLHNIHQQNQALLQVDRNMVVYNMNHHVQHHQGLQQNLVHQDTAVQGINIQQQYQNFNQSWYTLLNNATNSSQQQQNHVPIQQFPQNQHNLLPSNNAGNIVPPNRENIIRNLPAGYRFVPSDEELVNKYLKNKVENKPLPCNGLIHDVQIYDSNPYELIEQYISFEGQWYFFTSRGRKYPKGLRPRRNAVNGYWKPTGIEKTILHNNRPIGYKLVLDFYEGEHLKGPRTDLKMHEYRIQQKSDAPFTGTKENPGTLDKWVLCKIYRTRRGDNRVYNQEGDQTTIDQENHDQPLNGIDVGSSPMPILEESALNSNNDNLDMINTDADKNTLPTMEESAINSSNDNLMQRDNGRMINTNAEANTMPILEESAFSSSNENAKMIKTDANMTPTLEDSTLNSSNDNLTRQDNARMINIDADANTMPTLEELALNSENTYNNNVMQQNNVKSINMSQLDLSNIQTTSQSNFLNISNGCKKEWTSSQPDFWNILSGCEKGSTSTDICGIDFDPDYFTDFRIETPEPLDEHFFSDIEEDLE